jgi:hypothetical protein
MDGEGLAQRNGPARASSEAVLELPSAGGLGRHNFPKAIIPDSFPGTNLGFPDMVLMTTPQVTFKGGALFERTEFHSASCEADRFVCLSHTLEVFSEVKAARRSCVSRATMHGGRSISAKATVEMTRRPLLFITPLSVHRRHGRTSCWLDPVAIDPGRVKTSPSRECAELFSLSSFS